jgi:hypothetical protein
VIESIRCSGPGEIMARSRGCFSGGRHSCMKFERSARDVG